MAKTKVSVFILLCMLILSGCSKTEKKQLAVYSFCGENELFTVSNGVIVLSDTEEIFSGGNLKVSDDFAADIHFYSTKFYIISGDGESVICSSSGEDKTGGTIKLPGDLGKRSGDGIITRSRINDADDLKNNLYFELTTVDKHGGESVYQLQMSLREITEAAAD